MHAKDVCQPGQKHFKTLRLMFASSCRLLWCSAIVCEPFFSVMSFIHPDARNALKSAHLMLHSVSGWHERDGLLRDDNLFPEMMAVFDQQGLPL